MRRWVAIALICTLLLAAFGFTTYNAGKRAGIAAEDSIGSKYSLLAKRALINNPNDPLINFTGLRKQLDGYFEKNDIQGSLYFEYLPTGTTIRVNDTVEQRAASLLKIPAAMELYKAAELGKVNLDKTITLKREWLDPSYGDLYKKGAGYQLTLREAGALMLQKSDNTALQAVRGSTSGLINSSNMVFNAVDIDYTQDPDLTVAVSSRSYSSLLKCLYFSCYLNHADSQTILDQLANTAFNDRIMAGISDKTIRVAHKIGVIGDTSQADCGIIYLPSRNYILCMTIDGPDDVYVDKYMADMSHLVYDFTVHQE